jgi:anti-sigma regulatory factor (Ser/Thr protein kinase)
MSEPIDEQTGEERQRLVLVCGRDEELDNRLATVLPDWGVLHAGDNPGALALIQAKSIDMLLTGRETKGKEDLELLDAIRRTNPNARTRVIVRSGDSTRIDLIAAMREGAFSYFSRPHFDAAFDEILRHAASDYDWIDAIRVDSATPAWMRLLARCEIPTADRVIQFLNEASDLEGKERESMGFALKEIIMNGMEYGGKFDRNRWVEVSYVRGQRMLLYRVRDPGEGFSLNELSHSAISNPPEEPVRHLEVRESLGLRPGGYGVLLSRKLVDDLIYNEKGNDVLLIKYFDAPGWEYSDEKKV